MSNQLPSDIKKDIDLVSYTQTDQIVLTAKDIADQIMPALLLHFSKNKDKVEINEEMEKILEDLKEVEDTFKRLKRIEQLFNEQLKALLRPHLDRIQHHISGEEILADEIITDQQHLDIRQKVSNLKETLDFVPKVPLTGDDAIQPIKSSPTAGDDHDGETGDANIEGVELLSKNWFNAIQDSSPFKEIQFFYESLDNRKFKVYLLCLCIFPDNSIIKRRAIINWWIGEYADILDRQAMTLGVGPTTPPNVHPAVLDGFSFHSMDMIREADMFFNNLLSKGIIEPVVSKQKPLVKRCRMNPLTRQMLIALARRENFLEIGSSGEISVKSFSKSKKAFLVKTEEGSSQYSIRDSKDQKEMLTLFNINESFIDIQNHWFSKVKNLRVLQLGRWQASKDHHIEVASPEFLRQLSNMKQLRYLSLQGISMISELPVSFSNLVNLRILDLKACHDLRTLPTGIGKLKGLTILDMSECYFISHMPKEIALLSQLQVLKGFLVGDLADGDGDHCRLADLENLQKLKKLCIYADGQAHATETELLYLKKFKALRSLSIAWVGAPSSMPKKNARKLTKLLTRKFSKKKYSASRSNGVDAASRAQIMKTQQSNLNLEKLDLLCCPWESLPIWLNPQENSNLMKLYIRAGKLRDIRCHYSFGALEILRLKYLAGLEMEWEELEAAFPKLNYLEKVNCPKLSCFPCDSTGVWIR